jgi:hypothetical protein
MNDEGHLEVTVTPFGDDAKMTTLANEISEVIMRAFGPDALREFRQANTPTRGTH